MAGLHHQLVALVKAAQPVPFAALLFRDYAVVDAVTQGDVGKQIFATLDKAGVVPWPRKTATAKSPTQAGDQEPR